MCAAVSRAVRQRPVEVAFARKLAPREATEQVGRVEGGDAGRWRRAYYGVPGHDARGEGGGDERQV